ncbi:putative protease s8 tripeptidyl peptidase [Cladorrhinum samala]|uniref:Protease s8 tripeptidyl peptidase n=1 Tax=Cladorrhinum samala TaxID=585594 RepID=A0AAV9HV35_9PEZI|nr:putative protease s8 tripeptidyl peptidase [Cladorrhinum samala]
MFFERLQADHEGHRPKVDAINGGYLQLNETHPGKYHMEANLDVQYTMALTSPHEVTNVRVRSRSSIGNLNCMLAAFDQGLMPAITHGTSASNPVFASIVTLINSERMYAGKGPVGFINPVVYANPEALKDVMTGANRGCGVDEAFRAASGWDPTTGLGSPDYERLRELFMSLP